MGASQDDQQSMLEPKPDDPAGDGDAESLDTLEKKRNADDCTPEQLEFFRLNLNNNTELDLTLGRTSRSDRTEGWLEHIVNVKSILTFLNNNPQITSLKFHHNFSISEADFIVLLEFLKDNTTLTNLSLSGQSIQDKGTIALCEVLKVNTTLTRLDLTHNAIGDSGGLALVEALKVNKMLTSINLVCNPIHKKGSQYLKPLEEALNANLTTAITTAFISSVKDGNIEHTTHILENNVNPQNIINAKDPIKKTALNWAVNNGDHEMLALLIEKGAIDTPDPDTQETALLYAIKNNFVELARNILKNNNHPAHVNLKNAQGKTALHWAVQNRNNPMIELLIGNGAIDMPNPDTQETAYAYAYALKNTDDTSMKLVEYIRGNRLINTAKLNLLAFLDNFLQNMKKNIEDIINNPANSNQPTLKAALSKVLTKSFLDQTNANNETALYWAVKNRNKTMVEHLLQSGANPNIANANGKTALQLAVQNGDNDIIAYLVENGAIDTPNPDTQETALLSAVKNDNLKLVTNLLKTKSSTESINLKHLNKTPLTWAVQNGNNTMIELLVENGAIDEPRIGFKTALIHAVQSNNLKLVKQILQNNIKNNGSDHYINCKDPLKTAMDYAKQNGNYNILACIRGNELVYAVKEAGKNGHLILVDHCFKRMQDELNDFENINTTKSKEESEKELQSLKKLYLEQTDANGNSVLHSAVTDRNKTMVEHLLKSGANPHLANLDGDFPRDIAMALGARDIVQLLPQKQATAMMNDDDYYRLQARTAKELAHVYGFTNDTENPIRLTHPGTQKSTVIPFEGERLFISVELLCQFVKAYQQSGNAKNPEFLNKIMLSLEIQSEYLQCDPNVTEDTLMKMIQDGQLTMTNLMSYDAQNSNHHAVALVYYKKNDLVYCNRGFGKQTPTGTTVYLNTIQDETAAKITPAVPSASELREYCYGQNDADRPQAQIDEWVAKQPTEHSIGISLLSKDQIHGTCGFVNTKSSIQGILYLLERERLLDLGIINPDILHNQAKSYAADEYKRFTKFMRDEEIKKLIHAAKEALDGASQQSNTSDAQIKANNDVLFYKQLLIHAIKAHHGGGRRSSPTKRSEELERIQMIFRAFQNTPFMADIISELGDPYKTLFQPTTVAQATQQQTENTDNAQPASLHFTFHPTVISHSVTPTTENDAHRKPKNT